MAQSTAGSGAGLPTPATTPAPELKSEDASTTIIRKEDEDTPEAMAKRILACAPNDHWAILNSKVEDYEAAQVEFDLLRGDLDSNDNEQIKEALDRVMQSGSALNLDVLMDESDVKSTGAAYKRIYNKANTWVSTLIQNPDDSRAKIEIDKLNAGIDASNKKWGAPVQQGKIDLGFHIKQVQDAKPSLDKLRVDPTDAQASSTLDSINQLVIEYNSRKDYPSTWIIPKPTPPSSVAEPGSESNPVIVGAAGSSAPVNKSVGFADDVPIKQEASDEYKPDSFEGEEPPLITFDIGRTVDGDTGRLVGWSARARGDVEIYAYGPRNAPLYLWKSGVATRDEKSKCPKIDKRRGEEKMGGEWAYDKARVAGVRGICWRMDDYENEADPYGLNLIDLSKFGPKSRYPPTLIQVEWDDKERTWETRTAFRRIWRNQKLADKQILASARRCSRRSVKGGDWKAVLELTDGQLR